MSDETDIPAANSAIAPPTLDCYAITPFAPKIVAASPLRDWMDDFPDRHAYRCLPLGIANAYGWHVLSPCDLQITWKGGDAASDIKIKATDGYAHVDHLAASNFTRGIFTFHLGYIFRTSPGWQLLATGPFNQPKAKIVPLTGVIETEWLPYPFTMNWQFTREGIVRFAKDEPFCHILPVPQGVLAEVQPVIHDIVEDPELTKQYDAWKTKRMEFMTRFNANEPGTLRQAWQRFYFRGELPEADIKAPSHEHKLRLKPPLDKRRR
jgi:hypothetical protein